MDEIFSFVNSRILKYAQLKDHQVSYQFVKSPVKQSAYDLIRIYRDEEKKRIEKENWLINIMRSVTYLSQDQMAHIYVKTEQIMSLIQFNHPIGYTNPLNFKIFLRDYLKLYIDFFKKFNKQLTSSMKSAVKQGNMNCIADLLKLLVEISRGQFRKCIDDYSNLIQVNQSPKVIRTIFNFHRPQTQEAKYNDYFLPAKKMQTSPAKSEAFSNSFESKSIKFRDSNLIKKNVQYFQNVQTVIDDLEEQSITILEYQYTKKYGQSNEEIRQGFESWLSKIKMRNINIQQTLDSFISQISINKQITIDDQVRIISDRYSELNKTFLGWHYCSVQMKSVQSKECNCNLNKCFANSSSQSKLKDYLSRKSPAMQKSVQKPLNCYFVRNDHQKSVEKQDFMLQIKPLRLNSVERPASASLRKKIGFLQESGLYTKDLVF